MQTKLYKLGNYRFKGETLYKAILDSSRGCYNPPIMEDWVEDQMKSYLDVEYDDDAIRNIIFDNRMLKIIDILRLKGYDLESGYFDRNDIEKWITEAGDDNQRNEFIKLKKLFEDDLEGKRHESAYEKAWEDLNDMISNDINEDNDEEVAQFFGEELIIEGIECYYDDDEYSLKHCERCVKCNDYTPTELMEKIFYNFIESDKKFDQSMFVCLRCEDFYYIDKEHIEHNKHIDKNEFIVRMI